MDRKLEIVILILLSIIFVGLIYDTGIFFAQERPTIPGWHITIYPPYYIAKVIAAFLLFIFLSWRVLFLFFDRDN